MTRRRSSIKGAGVVRAQLTALPHQHRAMLENEWPGEVDRIHQGGLSWMDMLITPRTGTLRRLYKRQINKRKLSAAVGYVHRKDQRSAWHAHLVHHGTRKMAARPWHDLAIREGVPRMHRNMALLTEQLHRKALRRRSRARAKL